MSLERLLSQERILLKFEQRWRSGDPPVLVDFIDELAVTPPTDVMVELCCIDIERRRHRGIHVEIDDYFRSFPELYTDQTNRDAICKHLDRLTEQQVNEVPASASRSSLSSSIAASNTQAPLQPGLVVDQFVLGEQLGKGSFSTVYEATDTILKRVVAIKFLNNTFSENQNLRKRMLREAMAVAALDHPGIVPIYAVGIWNGIDYIVSRRILGPSLQERLSEQRFNERQAAEIARELALAVHHAHQMRVIHRDIKPANILMEENHPLLIDFGLALIDSEQSRLTLVGDIIGTPAYMSPEQTGNSLLTDGRCDVYSIGVLLYQMTCGQLPFQGTSTQVLSQIMHSEALPPRRVSSAIPRDLETIVLKSMMKDPADRYDTAQHLAEDLQRYLDGKPLRARRENFIERSTRFAKQRPIATVATLAMTFILAGLIGALSQLSSVRSQRDRALTAEQESEQAKARIQTLLAQTAANAGRLAMQRGHWATAMDQFDSALQGGFQSPAESRPILLDKLSAFVSSGKSDEARTLLALNESVIGIGSAEQCYWNAELALLEPDSIDDCLNQFRRAKELGIATDAAFYVDGMLSTTTPQAVAAFRQALNVNPLHHRARRQLVLLLMSMARLDEAYSEAKLGQQLFPEDLDFALQAGMVLALQGHLEQALASVPTDAFSESATRTWHQALNSFHHFSKTLQLFPDASGFDARQIADFLEQLNKEWVPLFVERGWVLPPLIASQFTGLTDLFLEWSVDANHSEAPSAGDSVGLTLSQQLAALVKIHPEGTLALLYSYVEFTRLQLHHVDVSQLTIDQIAGFEAMRDNYRRSLHQPFLVNCSRDEVRRSLFTAAMILAMFAERDTDQNRRIYVEALSGIESMEMLPLQQVRVMVIALIEAEAYGEAERWTENWVERTDRKNLDAFWHLMIVAQRQQDWLLLEELGREGIQTFPGHQPLVDFHHHAQKKIREILDLQSDQAD